MENVRKLAKLAALNQTIPAPSAGTRIVRSFVPRHTTMPLFRCAWIRPRLSIKPSNGNCTVFLRLPETAAPVVSGLFLLRISLSFPKKKEKG